MPTIADWVFVFLDIACLTFCSAYLVTLLPHDKKRAQNKILLRITRSAAWIIFASLTVMPPRIWQDDAITMIMITSYYIFVGYLLYHHNRIGILYQVGFMFCMYATQMIAILIAAKLYEVCSLEYKTFVYMMIFLKPDKIMQFAFFRHEAPPDSKET